MWQIIQKWHRTIGIISSLFVIFLSISGFLLNHTEQLNLDSRYIQQQSLLDFYNIKPEKEPYGFNAGDHWVTLIGDKVYFNNTELAGTATELVGALFNGEMIVIAYDGQLLLVTPSGEIIEKLTGTQGVPAGMRAIGLTGDNNIVIRGAHGDYQVDLDQLNWHEEELIEANWSARENLPENLLTDLLHLYRGKGLTLERVLLDIHSGRLVGNWGVYMVDAVAVLFLLLAISGIWMWFKRKV